MQYLLLQLLVRASEPVEDVCTGSMPGACGVNHPAELYTVSHPTLFGRKTQPSHIHTPVTSLLANLCKLIVFAIFGGNFAGGTHAKIFLVDHCRLRFFNLWLWLILNWLAGWLPSSVHGLEERGDNTELLVADTTMEA